MRLVIAFDINFDFKSTDLVVGKVKPKSVDAKQFIKVDAVKTTDYVKELEDFKSKIVSEIQSQVIKGAIFSSINNFNRNWIIPLFKWIDTVDNTILNNKIDEIVIVGYTKNFGYIPYYEAEGEIGSQFFYKDFDVIPALIYSYLNNKGISNVKIKNKKSTFKLKVKIFIRRYIFLVLKLMLFYLKKLKSLKYNSDITGLQSPRFLFITRSIAHSEYIYKFLKKHNDEIIIHTSDGLSAGNKNLNFINKHQFKNVVSQESKISILEATTIFFKTVKALAAIPKKQYLEVSGININFSSAMLEMLISYFDALLHKKSISNTIKDKQLKLFTGEMYTPFAYVISEIGSEHKLQTFQLQTTAMMLRKEPDFMYCETFLMNSKANAIAFKKLYPLKANHIDYYGSLLIDEKDLNSSGKGEKTKKIIFFTQPKMEEEIEFKIIENLINLQKKYDFKIYIKLHPRDPIDKLNHFEGQLNIIENNLIFNEYIQGFDLAIIRNTSLGSSILIEGIPLVVCLLTENTQKSKLDYINHDYYGTIFNIKELEKRIVNREKLNTEFFNFRKEFIKNNELTKGVNYFYKCFEV